jgi:hypothetical protein
MERSSNYHTLYNGKYERVQVYIFKNVQSEIDIRFDRGIWTDQFTSPVRQVLSEMFAVCGFTCLLSSNLLRFTLVQ